MPSASSQPIEPDLDEKSQFTQLRGKKELFDYLSKNPKNQKLSEYKKLKEKQELEGCTFMPKIYSNVKRDND